MLGYGVGEWITAGILGVFGLALLIGFKACSNSSASTENAPTSAAAGTTNTIGAWTYMKLFVEKRLQSPSSADFPFGGSRDVVALGDDRYSVESYVDSQNAFGATVRTYFAGVIKEKAGGWELESLDTGPTPQKSITNQQTVQPTPISSPSSNGPESTKGENWEYLVNNAVRTANRYAETRNPLAFYSGPGMRADFVEQVAGKHKGRYLLKLTNDSGSGTSFAMLLPLFDENKPSDGLDDEGKLWKVVSAKYNGRAF